MIFLEGFFISRNSSLITRNANWKIAAEVIFAILILICILCETFEKTTLKNLRLVDINIPEWFSKEEQKPIENSFGKIYNPKPLKQSARDNNKLEDKEIDKESAKK